MTSLDIAIQKHEDRARMYADNRKLTADTNNVYQDEMYRRLVMKEEEFVAELKELKEKYDNRSRR